MQNNNGPWQHFRTCNLCEAMCGIEISLQGKTITSIRGDQDDPFSHGHICPKATALQDIYEDPDRLKIPIKRMANGWLEISWDQAFDEVAVKLRGIQDRFGHDAVGIYLGNPNVHNLGSMMVGSIFYRALQTHNLFSATSVDQLPHHVAARHMFGHRLLLPIPDIDRTSYFFILGANPLVSNGSIMTAGGFEARLKALQKRGGKVVVVDPRRTETGKMADEHLFITPGSDVLLLLSLTHTLLSENLVDLGKLSDFCKGLPEIQAAVASYTPEHVAQFIKIGPTTIRRLAREIATAESAVVYGRMGVSTQRFGGLCQWLINLINILTGNLDKPGGAMFPTPALDIVQPYRAGEFGRWASRVRGLPEFASELPVAALAEEILTPGEGQIKALVSVAGNPVLSTPNGRQVDEALASLEFMVAIDIYLNETTRHADIILPPTTGLETDHYDVSFHTFAVRNSAKYCQPLFEPQDYQRHDWQIFRELARRMATAERPYNESDPRNMLTPAQMLDFGLRTGPYGQDGLSLQKLLDHPHGIDLGPLKEQLPDRLFTQDKQIDAAPLLFINDLDRVDREFFQIEKSNAEYPLQLIGKRDLRSNNSWMHNSRRLVKGKNRCRVLINPLDAENVGLQDGQTAVIESRAGQIELPIEVSTDMMPGVISIPHGWGHDRPGTQLTVAAAHPGASANDITDELDLDTLTGNAILNGIPVRIS